MPKLILLNTEQLLTLFFLQLGNVEVIEFLIEHGADINGQANSGEIPLHGAAVFGNCLNSYF